MSHSVLTTISNYVPRFGLSRCSYYGPRTHCLATIQASGHLINHYVRSAPKNKETHTLANGPS